MASEYSKVSVVSTALRDGLLAGGLGLGLGLGLVHLALRDGLLAGGLGLGLGLGLVHLAVRDGLLAGRVDARLVLLELLLHELRGEEEHAWLGLGLGLG